MCVIRASVLLEQDTHSENGSFWTFHYTDLKLIKQFKEKTAQGTLCRGEVTESKQAQTVDVSHWIDY